MDTDLTASQAFASARKVGPGGTAAADDLNYTLTLKRLLASVKAASEAGETCLAYVAPWIVMDGTTTDQLLLARQLARRLTELGYMVTRDGPKLYIDWDFDLQRKEESLRRANMERHRRERAEAEESLRALRRRAREGDRRSQRLSAFAPVGAPPLDRPPRAGGVPRKAPEPGRSQGFTVRKRKKGKA